MRCTDFLHLYSEYRDGRLRDPALKAALERHARECAPCARFDLAIRRGVNVLRAVPQLQPSPGFRRTLRLRLLTAPLYPFPAPARMAASLLVAAAVALFVIEGMTRSSAADLPLTPLAQVVVNPGPPFVGFAEPSRAEAAPGSLTGEEDADSAARAASVAP